MALVRNTSIKGSTEIAAKINFLKIFTIFDDFLMAIRNSNSKRFSVSNFNYKNKFCVCFMLIKNNNKIVLYCRLFNVYFTIVNIH